MASALAPVAENENVIDVYLGHLRLEQGPFTQPDGTVVTPSVFLSVDFLEHVTQTTEVVSDLSPTFDKTFVYTVVMNEFLQYYLQNKTLGMHLAFLCLALVRFLLRIALALLPTEH